MELIKHIRHFDALEFTVVAECGKDAVGFSIYESQPPYADNPRQYFHARDTCAEDYTESFEDAKLFAHGIVMWDGCSNWYFDVQDEVLIHGCCRSHLARIGQVLAECWDWTSALIADEWYPQTNETSNAQ